MNEANKSVIVPFGKYKGQPVEVMAQDRQYCDWLSAQPWFRERNAELYTVIVNNFSEPTETPEHNALQVLFLDHDFCRRFASVADGVDFSAAKIERLEFEYSSLIFKPRRPPVDVLFSVNNGERCGDFPVEIKPTIGDDYPAVLRQMKNSGAGYLFVETYAGVGATREQFIKTFEASGLCVIFKSEVEAAGVKP